MKTWEAWRDTVRQASWFWCCIVTIGVGLPTETGNAQQAEPPGTVEASAPASLDAGSADGIDGTIHERNGIFGKTRRRGQPWRKGIGDAGTWWQETLQWRGLDAAFTYDALTMGALNDAADWAAASGDASLSLRWRVNADDSPRPLAIAARMRHRHTLGGGRAPSELRAATDALWGYVDGFNDSGLEFPDLYVQQRFFEKRFLLRYGQMSIDDLLDDHRMRSPKRSFLNQAFSSSPAVGFPGTGLGLVTRWESPRGWDLTFTASNIESANLNDEADWSFDTDSLFEGLQLGGHFDGLQNQPARVQLLLWNADALPEFGLASGRGASLTVEQKWRGRWNSFLRLAWSDGEATPASRLIATGISRAAGDEGLDRFGAAIAAGASSSEDGRWQQSLEVFYRRQVGSLQITPDVQLNFGDGIGGDAGWLLLAGLRVGFTF